MDAESQDKLRRLTSGLQKVVIYRDMIQNQIIDLETQEQKLRYHVELRTKEGEILKSWLEDSIHKNIDSISELTTNALRHIISDQEISFRIQPEPRNNRLAMKFLVEQDGFEGDPLDSFGGGAAVVISLVLRLAIMARMNMGNLLLLDESLSALADVYIPSCGDFMRQLSEQTGINILMVTHNASFLGHAHVSYEAISGPGGFILKRI